MSHAYQLKGKQNLTGVTNELSAFLLRKCTKAEPGQSFSCYNRYQAIEHPDSIAVAHRCRLCEHWNAARVDDALTISSLEELYSLGFYKAFANLLSFVNYFLNECADFLDSCGPVHCKR